MTDRIERGFLAVAYSVAVTFPLAILLFYDGTERLEYFDTSARESGLVPAPDEHRRVLAVLAFLRA